ncbi:transcriptional regulator, LysR family [Faunimonas pinastri]|uniref:Transcriptional regulator, LysR family n=1 Tax=Faunimonas pinastri TaxID=1855383 RepID=A0A1H9K0Z2_9HYPH|nr:LysR substrate-binding domain-containing protein [Faunimonas pinastri]SEQ92906.1 transcriptional regulator, LysR family [Faunimonas pinastri]
MIDIRQMRYFVALAETLHFGRAAERLNLSQPPLSRQIAALERELGVRLVERHSRQASLAAAGKRFLQDSRAVLASFDEACRNAKLADEGELGELAIGFMMHAAYGALPGIARRYMAAYPGVRLSLREVIPSLLPQLIMTGQFDAGITFHGGGNPALESRSIHRERLCLVVPPGHRLADRETVQAADLEGEALIATHADVAPILRNVVVDFCRAAGFEPLVQLEAQLQQTIVRLVAEGLGIALVPETMRKIGFADVVFRDLEDAPVVEHVIAWRRGNLNPALKPFLRTAGIFVEE